MPAPANCWLRFDRSPTSANRTLSAGGEGYYHPPLLLISRTNRRNETRRAVTAISSEQPLTNFSQFSSEVMARARVRPNVKNGPLSPYRLP